MTIRHLKVFIKVCEFGSISKAANELCIAQPSVSQTIKELEKYYDVILFDRVNKKLKLTKEGETLLAKAKEVVTEFDEFESLAGKGDLNPTVRVGATMSFGEFVLPNFVKELKKELPEVDPYIYIDKVKGLEDKVSLGDLDFAIAEGVISNKSLTTKSVTVFVHSLKAVVIFCSSAILILSFIFVFSFIQFQCRQQHCC